MSEHIKQMAENKLVTQLSQMRQDFDALKTAQPFGSTSVRLQRVVTGNAADFSVTSTYHVINIWEVVYTPDSTALANTGFLWQMFFNGFNVSGSGVSTVFIDLVGIISNAWTYRFYVVGITPSQTQSFQVQVVVYAMTKGSISISQIA